MRAAGAAVRLHQPSPGAQPRPPQPVSSSPQQSSRTQARLLTCQPPGRSPAPKPRTCLMQMCLMRARPAQARLPRTAARVCSASALTARNQTTARCHIGRQTCPARRVQVAQAQKPMQLPCLSRSRPPFSTPPRMGLDQESLQVGRAEGQGSRDLRALQLSLTRAAPTRPGQGSKRRGLKAPMLALLGLLPAVVRKLGRKLVELLRRLQGPQGLAARRRPALSASTPSPASSGCAHGALLLAFCSSPAVEGMRAGSAWIIGTVATFLAGIMHQLWEF